jgi:hypothetical protein
VNLFVSAKSYFFRAQHPQNKYTECRKEKVQFYDHNQHTRNSSMQVLMYAAVRWLTRLLSKAYKSCLAQPTEAVEHSLQ